MEVSRKQVIFLTWKEDATSTLFQADVTVCERSLESGDPVSLSQNTVVPLKVQLLSVWVFA